MLNCPKFVFIASVLSFLACGPSGEGGRAEAAGAETVSVDSSDVGYGTQDDDATDNQLALEPGLYVIDGTDCASPASAGFRVWTGQGLEGSNTQGCRFEVSARDGDVYSGRQSCDQSPTTELSIEVLEPGSIVLTEADEPVHLTLCPEGEVPDWARERMEME